MKPIIKSKKARTAACLLILAAAALLTLSALAYPYIKARLDLPYMTFEPFSGRCFDFEPEKVWQVTVPGDPYVRCLKSDEEIAEVLDLLNSFRYRFWRPEPMGREALPLGVTRFIRIDMVSPQPGGPEVIVYFFEDRLMVNDVLYYGDPDYIKKLRGLGD